MKKLLAVLCAILAAIMLATCVSSTEFFWDFPKKNNDGETIGYHEVGNLWLGYPDGKFHPEKIMTRAEFISILYRMYDLHCSGITGYAPTFNTPAVRRYDGSFSDVPEGSWFYDAVVWAYENGIVNGTGDGKFSPSEHIGIFEYAIIMYRYYELYFNDDFLEFVNEHQGFYSFENYLFCGDRINYTFYTYKTNKANDPEWSEQLLNNAVLFDVPDWFFLEAKLADVLKYDIWIGGKYSTVDMTDFSATRENIFHHTHFDYIDAHHSS